MKLHYFVALLFLLLVFLWIEQPWVAVVLGLFLGIYAIVSVTARAGKYIGGGIKKHGSQMYSDLEKTSSKPPEAMKTIDSSLKELGKKFREGAFSSPNTKYKSPNTMLRASKGLNNFVEGLKRLFKK